MPKTILNSAETQEACAAMMGLTGARAKTEAMRLAGHYGCHWSRIYEVTRNLRPRRKPRSDRGRCRADLKEHAGMSMATSLVVAHNLDPDLALETARANGHETPVQVGTYRRYLREAGLNRRQLRSRRVVHRRFEASAPGEIYQFDISGVKERWVDIETRRILHVSVLEVSKNHPNKKSNRMPLWKFTLKDDHSRKLFFRFVACEKPNSCDVIDFELQAFREMGVPLVLYTDNDAIIKSRLNRRAASILDRAFTDSGGFKLDQHLPGNPNATGKVESAHLLVEKYEKEIGIGALLGYKDTLDDLNRFAAKVCYAYNWKDHRTTGEKPEIRFRSGHGVMRVPPAAVLNDAFKAREFQVKVNADVTIAVDAKRWQLPRSARIGDVANPFVDLAALGKSVQVIWPIEASWFVAVAGGNEFEIIKTEAGADAANQFKTIAESTTERNTKHFKAVAAEMRKAARAGQTIIVRPGFETEFEIAAEEKPAIMPRKKVETDPALLAELGVGIVPPSAVAGRLVSFFEALGLLIDEEILTASESDKLWLRSVFNGRDQVNEPEVRAALEARESEDRVLRSA